MIGDHNVRLLTLAESVAHWEDRTVRASKKRTRVDLLGEAMVVTRLEPECKRIMPAHSVPVMVTSPGMTTSLTPDYGDEVAIDLTVPAMPEGAMSLLEGDLFEEYVPQTKTSEIADDPIIQVISGEEFEREVLQDSGEDSTRSAETELVLLEAVRGVGLGTESLVTGVHELTGSVGELTQRIPATIEQRLTKLEKEMA